MPATMSPNVPPTRKPPRPQPLPPPKWTYHRKRRLIHALCFLVFMALPFFNVVRFDIPRQRFYFAGYELWISEFAIIFFSLLFLMFIVVGMALLYGRVYCGYLCPQTIFSEAAQGWERAITRLVTKKLISWPVARRRILERVVSILGLAAGSVFLAFIFISYFVEPRDLLSRLAALDIQSAGGIAGAVVTLITFLDFAFIRQTFCTTACPYGYLQGMLVDKQSLLVEYRDPNHACIECKKCVRVCPMDIDIRDSPFQLECTHCGECVDACTDVLGRLGQPTLIHYAWGEQGQLTRSAAGGAREPWYRRIGLRDPKRLAVLAILGFYATGLMTALSMRHTVLVQVRADRGEKLYRIEADGRIANHFRLRLANRGSKKAYVTLRPEGLAGATLSIKDTITVPAAETIETEFDILAPASTAQGGEVQKFKIISHATPENTVDMFDTTFLSPRKSAP